MRRFRRDRDRSPKWLASTRSRRFPASSGAMAACRISLLVSTAMAAKLAPKMRALKLLVISLGVLLLLGIGALAAAVVWRIDHGRPVSTSKAASAAQRIMLPAGAKVVSTDVDAGRLVARIDVPGG